MGLLSKLGFAKEGVLKEYSKIDGAYVDEHVFSMLRRDWRGRPHG
jgi:RimJ/RimL family protein N-acetyltransferase